MDNKGRTNVLDEFRDAFKIVGNKIIVNQANVLMENENGCFIVLLLYAIDLEDIVYDDYIGKDSIIVFKRM